MPPISVPTSSALPGSQRVAATNPGVTRILSKLSRSSLLSLALDWLDERNQELSAPYIANEEEEEDAGDLYPPAHSLDELREEYTALLERKGTKRDLVDRIVEGDWRSGLSLYQLSMADLQYLYDHPHSQKWSALKVVQLHDTSIPNVTDESQLPVIPRFHPPTFLQNLQRSILPDIKAHYNLDRPPGMELLLLRIFMLDSPYNTSLSLSSPTALDSAKTIYIAFPDASPHIFVSLTTALPTSADATAPPNAATTADAKSLRKIVLDCIPKAFSKPRARYGLMPTNLSARSLSAMTSMRGGQRTNAAGGVWGVYAEEGKGEVRKDTPLNLAKEILRKDEEAEEEKENAPVTDVTDKTRQLTLGLGMKRKKEDDGAPEAKLRRIIALRRFGQSGRHDDGKGIERFDVRIEDPFPHVEGDRNSDENWTPDVRVTFHGGHVFAGVRKLVERGVMDGAKMPGWMTGEEGVSIGVVQKGKIIGFKGSGL